MTLKFAFRIGQGRSLKVTPVNPLRVISYSYLIQFMRYNTSTGPKSLYFASPLSLMPPTEGLPWDCHYIRKILHGGQKMAKVHSGEEILAKASAP